MRHRHQTTHLSTGRSHSYDHSICAFVLERRFLTLLFLGCCTSYLKPPSTQRFEAELYKQSAQIAASPHAQVWLENGRVKVVALPEDDLSGSLPPNWKQFLLPIESVEHGMRQLLGFGAKVKVIAPNELEIALRDELLRLHHMYKDIC
jgi:predicted DNA-binding transcriptional regulator YafY